MNVEVYTDGACRGNPGPGGYGILMRFSNGDEKRLSEGYFLTTNNRMELTALANALEFLRLSRFRGEVYVFTDSKYVSEAINKGWLNTWESQNFHKRINADLWIKISKSLKFFTGKIKIQWVKGHDEVEGNLIADSLAVNSSLSPTEKDLGYGEGDKD